MCPQAPCFGITQLLKATKTQKYLSGQEKTGKRAGLPQPAEPVDSSTVVTFGVRHGIKGEMGDAPTCGRKRDAGRPASVSR